MSFVEVTSDRLCRITRLLRISCPVPIKCDRGKTPNVGRCLTSYQEVLNSLLRNVNHQADEAGPCNHSTNGQFLRTSVLTESLYFGAL